MSLLVRLEEFAVEHLVIESGGSRILAGRGHEDRRRPCPVDRTEAHRTRLARGVDRATGELKRSEILTRIPDRDDLSMCRRIVVRRYLIESLADDASVFDDHAAERPAE